MRDLRDLADTQGDFHSALEAVFSRNQQQQHQQQLQQQQPLQQQHQQQQQQQQHQHQQTQPAREALHARAGTDVVDIIKIERALQVRAHIEHLTP